MMRKENLCFHYILCIFLSLNSIAAFEVIKYTTYNESKRVEQTIGKSLPCLSLNSFGSTDGMKYQTGETVLFRYHLQCVPFRRSPHQREPRARSLQMEREQRARDLTTRFHQETICNVFLTPTFSIFRKYRLLNDLKLVVLYQNK